MVSILSLILCFLLITTAIFIVYQFFFRSSSGNLTGYMCYGYAGPVQLGEEGERRQEIDTLLCDLEAWCKKNRALLLNRNNNSHIGVFDSAGWFRDSWGVDFDGFTRKQAIVKDDPGILSVFMEDGVLFPRQFRYQVVGRYSDEAITPVQGDAFYYISLRDYVINKGEIFGELYTDVTDEAALTELKEILHRGGCSGLQQIGFATESLSVPKLVRHMLRSDPVSRSLLLAVLGLLFCGAFSVSMLYRESNRSLRIHHLYGATYRRLYLRLLLELVGTAVVGTGLAYLVAWTQLSMLSARERLELTLLGGGFSLVFILITDTVCCLDWVTSNRGKERRF